MKINQLIKWVRRVLIAMLLVCALLVSGFVIYLDVKGVPAPMKNWVLSELAKQGFYFDYKETRISLIDGLEVEGASLYRDESKDEASIVASGGSLHVDAYKILFWIGKIRPKKLVWQDYKLQLNGMTSSGEMESYVFSNLNGSVNYDDESNFHLNSASASWNGWKVVFRGEIPRIEKVKAAQETGEMSPFDIPSYMVDVLEGLKQVKLQGEIKNEIIFEFKKIADSEWDLILKLNILGVEYQGVELERLVADLRYEDGLIKVLSLTLDDGEGEVKAKGWFSPNTQELSLDVESDLNGLNHYQNFMGDDFALFIPMQLSKEVQFLGHVEGSFSKGFKAFGSLKLEDIVIDGVAFDEASAMCAYEDGDFVIRNICGKRADYVVNGEIMSKDGRFDYAFNGNFPAEDFFAILKHFSFYRFLRDISYSDGGVADFNVWGYSMKVDRSDWHCDLSLQAKQISYKGQLFKKLDCEMEFLKNKSYFRKIKATPDYSGYALREEFSGPLYSDVSVDEIFYDNERRRVHIAQGSGTAWPAPLVRMFAVNVADVIEDFRIHRPTKFDLNGYFDLTEKRAHAVNFSFDAEKTNYVFLDRDTPFDTVKGKGELSGKVLTFDGMKMKALEGTWGLNIGFDFEKEPFTFNGDVKFNKVFYESLAKVHEIDQENDGVLSGELFFSGKGDNPAKLDGRGKMKMREAKLFSIPIFGRLSSVIDKIILSKGTFEQKATELSADFMIKDGVLATQNFHTRTGNLHFDGTGWIDLPKQEIDLTLQVKGRGLIEILNLPLRPLYGIFRYRGKGKLSNPEWKLAPYRKGETER